MGVKLYSLTNYGRRLREHRLTKKLGGGDGGAFIPQYLENVIAPCHSKRD